MNRMGRFSIVSELGQGAFGVVYQVFDTEAKGGEFLALKVAAPEILDTKLEQRFHNELKALEELEHPNIVRVLECGKFGPVPYLLLEHCDGGNLEDFLDTLSRPLSGRQAARVVIALGRALEHAHSRGILHRDLKPGNVLLRRRATSTGFLPASESEDPLDGFEIKLADFGLAKFLRSGDSDLGKTETRTPIGTPSYLAPEQARGDEEIDERADVFGLGCLLYRVAVGKKPFEASSDWARMMKNLYDEPIPPRDIRPDLHRDLESIILNCLRNRPEERYGSARELCKDLERWLARRRPKARLRRWLHNAGEARAAFVAVLVLFVVAIAGGLVYAASSFFAPSDSAHKAAADVSPIEHSLKLGQYIQDTWRARESSRMVEVRSRIATPDPQLKNDLNASFAWRWLRRHSAPDWVWTNRVNDETIYKLVYFPDGSKLASAGKDQTVRIWNAADGTLLRTLKGHTDEVDCVDVSSDGRRLVSCGDDGRIFFWDLDRAAPVELGRRNCEVVAVLFANQGKQVIAGDNDGVVTVWDVRTRKLAAEYHVADDRIEDMVLTSDGASLAVAARGCPLQIFEAESLKLKRTLTAETEASDSINAAFSRDGMYCAGSNALGRLYIWNLQTGALERARNDGPTYLHSLVFGPESEYVAAASRAGYVVLEPFKRGFPTRKLHGDEATIWGLALSPDGKTLVTSDNDGVLKARHPKENPDWLQIVSGDFKTAVVCGFSADSSQFVAMNGEGSFKVIHRFEPSHETAGQLTSNSPIYACGLAADARFAATLERQGLVRIWDRVATKALADLPFKPRNQGQCRLSFSADGQLVMAEVLGTSEAAVWEWRSGKKLYEDSGVEPQADARVRALGKRLLLLCDHRTATVWDLDKHAVLRRVQITDEPGEILSVACSANDEQVVVYDDRRTATIFAVSSGGLPRRRFAAYNPPRFSTGGETIVTIAPDGSIQVWSTDAALLLMTFPALAYVTPHDVFFSPDDSSLAVAMQVRKAHSEFRFFEGLPAPASMKSTNAPAPATHNGD
ncbi:MAG: protein kinase [Planctomycetota bacterium]|nr:protein kinase [Planctomycetota bacterium]